MIENILNELVREFSKSDLKELSDLKDRLYKNYENSSKFDCFPCQECEFKYSVVETYILNKYKHIQNRRTAEVKINAQNFLDTKFQYNYQ